VDASLRRANPILPPKRYAAYRAVERRLLAGELPIAPLENGVLPEYFSVRLGCRVFQPVYGMVDIGALCVHGR